MKTTIRCKTLLAVLGLIAVQTAVRADTIIYNFNNGFDYQANGVPGTIWDGVYLGFGDVYGGDDAGDVGFTLQANETANSGFLTVQDNLTDWSGTGDDGFFLYKVVAGDFDVSVENVEPWDNSNPANNHMGGLMARAFPTSGPHWSQSFGGSENWQDEFRFMAFNIDEDIRYATNGVDHDAYITVPGVNTDTNSNRYFRITRVGNVFSFYTKTNQPDAWTLHGSLTRADLAGVPIQVGIADATFGDGTGGGTLPAPTSFYTDFELTGTNVVAAPTPPANPTGLVSAVASVTNLTYTWNPGAGSAGSILVLRKDNPLSLQQKPINSYVYNASNHFGSGDDLGGGMYVVFAGAGNSVTVTGLGTTNHTYYAAVYSYSGSGATTVYGATPATTNSVGPNVYVGLVYTTTPSTGIPVNGAAITALSAFDAFGNTDSVPNTSAVWSTTAAGVAVVGTDGTITGTGAGSANIIASYSGLNVTNAIAVHAAAYTDNFSTTHDYLANGLPGTTWNGLYLTASDVPNASAGPPFSVVSDLDANTTSNNELTMRSFQSAWQGGEDNGPFLFQNVPGDFQASVHISGYDIIRYQFTGLQARSYSLADSSSPSGPGFSENFIDWLRFDEFGNTSLTFNTVNGGNTETDNNDGENNNYWLLMVRNSGTNFYFFKKVNLTDPWKYQPNQTTVRSDLTNGVPMQVGLVQSLFYNGNTGSVHFDSFSLDAANISGGTPPSATTGLVVTEDSTHTQATINWIPGTNSNGSVQTTMVVMRKGAPVTAQPYFGILTSTPATPDNFGDSTDFGGGNFLVYRGTGSNQVVTGLVPGVQYYVAVYGFSSSGTTKSFNLLGSASGVTPPVVLTGITASISPQGIPVNGIGIPVVIGAIQGGGSLDVTKNCTFAPASPILVASNGVITGLTAGITTNTVSIVNGVNTLTTTLVTTVRPADYTDNFGTSQDYVANGVTGTTWDGVYAYPKFTIPDSTFVSSGSADVFSADANITSNGVLTVTSENVGFENPQNDGFFLFKWVPEDFQVAVHINASLLGTNNTPINYNYPGLLCRPWRISSNSIAGAPYYTNAADSFVTWSRFDNFGIGTRAERILRGNTTALPSADVGDEQRWLLMVRQHGTNFTFYQKSNLTDPWVPGPAGQFFNVTNFIGLPMQVGIQSSGFDSGNPVTAGFDTFSLDVGQVVLQVSSSGGNIVLSWPALGGYTLQKTPSLAPTSWSAVSTPPTTVDGLNSVTLPATGSGEYFRLIH